jgi:hypothetical protein
MNSPKKNDQSGCGLKRLFILMIFLLPLTINAQQPGVAINNTGNPPDPSAMLDVSASKMGVLIPRISILDLPAFPAPGLLVYVYDLDPGFWYYDGFTWSRLMRTTDEKWKGNPDIYYANGKVAIGTSLPTVALDVESNSATADGLDINLTGTGDP